MKKLTFIAASAMLVLANASMPAQNADTEKRAFMLFGASFAIAENGWFEIACENMGVEPLNKAVSGQAIYHDAQRMNKGTDYTTDELDRTDVLVIMHVHNQNVANTANLQDNWEDYTNISSTQDYAVAYDYVIKRYKADCAALENNPSSKWFGVPGGKPAKIMLCTHWNDSRTTYNPAIRTLAEKFDLPLVEFDKNIGFSKDDNPDDPGAPSRAMAHDKETIGGVDYGWHPLRGINRPIQQRMAAIFTKTVEDTYGQEFPFEVSVLPFCPIYMEGEDAKFAVRFSNGMFPYSVSSNIGSFASNDNLDGNINVATLPALTKNTAFSVEASSSAWADKAPVTKQTSADVLVADYCATPDYDSYVSQLNGSSNYDTEAVLQLKQSYDASRKVYLSFQVGEDMPRNADRIILRLFYKDYTAGYFEKDVNRPHEGIEYIRVEGNTGVYSKVNWSLAPSHSFDPIESRAQISSDMAGSWVGIDVTDWANQTLSSLEERWGNKYTGHLTFRLFVEDNNSGTLMNFYSTEGATAAAVSRSETTPGGPQLLFTVDDETSGVADVTGNSQISVLGCNISNPANERICIYGIDGICRYTGNDASVSMADFPRGIYIIKCNSKTLKYTL